MFLSVLFVGFLVWFFCFFVVSLIHSLGGFLMLLSVPRRSQAQLVLDIESGVEDEAGLLSSLSIPLSEDRARQEFGPDVDIATVLARHGGGALIPAQPLAGFGSAVDYDIDLSSALSMVAEARRAYSAAPADVLRRFPSFGQFVSAIDAGFVGVRDVPEPLVVPAVVAISATPAVPVVAA